MIVEMQCGMCGVVWDSAMYNLYPNVVMCAWRDVEWCAEMWWSDLVRSDVSVYEMWCDVECCNFRHGVTY